MKAHVQQLLEATENLSNTCELLQFSVPENCVYNPLQYARTPHFDYLKRYAPLFRPGGTLFLGMNPGPWGMAQTGVPFGEVAAVRDWLGICDNKNTPTHSHPARPVSGFACPRSEVSGKRLWGLFAEEFATPEKFFANHFVYNYCPLMFLQTTGDKCRNLTPDKLPTAEQQPLFAACDALLRQLVQLLQPTYLIGVGVFAEKRLQSLFSSQQPAFHIGRILHPSPASPASHDFIKQARRQLIELGVWRT